MSQIDTTFAAIPASLLNQWGQTMTYIKASAATTYNTQTGIATRSDTNIPLKAVITQANPEEFEGVYQTSDVKLIIGNVELAGHYPSIADRIQYSEGARTIVARIIAIKTYRGDSPILHTLLVRPQ
jgi:hypothetical protein